MLFASALPRPTAIWGSISPDTNVSEPADALGNWERALLSEGTQTAGKFRQRSPHSQPGTGRPVFYQPEPNEICTSQNLSSQIGWRLPVHVFVFLKGIDLKKERKEKKKTRMGRNLYFQAFLAELVCVGATLGPGIRPAPPRPSQELGLAEVSTSADRITFPHSPSGTDCSPKPVSGERPLFLAAWELRPLWAVGGMRPRNPAHCPPAAPGRSPRTHSFKASEPGFRGSGRGGAAGVN